MGVVAPEILDKDVGCVGLGREAVIANINSGVCHTEPVHIVRIEAVRVLRFSLLHSKHVRQPRQLDKGKMLTEALVENAWMYTSSNEMSLVRTKKLVQQGEFNCVMPSTLTRVALSVRKRMGR